MKKGFIHTFCEQGNARDSTRLVYAVKIMIYDVTVPITNTMPIWPGDPPVELVPMSHESRNKTHIVNLTAIAMGSHTGTHIDAPFHMIKSGKRLHEFSLEILVGKATVFEVPGVRSIRRADLKDSTGHRLSAFSSRQIILRIGGTENFTKSSFTLTPAAPNFSWNAV